MMSGTELYELIASHYADFKKMADEGTECMKYIYDFNDVDDFVLNGFFDKDYFSFEKKMLKHGEEIYDTYIKKSKDEKFKKLRSMYAHDFIGAMWKAKDWTKELNCAIKTKNARAFCDVMACRSDVTDKYFAMIARVENWLKLNIEKK